MLRSFQWGFVALALAACLGCSSGEGEPADVLAEREPIVGGTVDRGKDPAVVAIDIGGEGLCTGSLIAPRWVLTARHCVSETAEAVQCPSRAPQVRGARPADSLTILVGDDAQTARPVAVGRRVVVPDSNQLCDHDLALIELDRALTSIAPLALSTLSGVETVRGVGFGKRGDNAAAGKKMTRSNVPILDSSAAEFEVGVLSCSGDSGGPALDSRGRVVGVVSRGGPNCSGRQSRNIYTRVDAFRELIDETLSRNSSGTGAGTGTGVSTGTAECGPGKRCANGTRCNPSTLRCEASS